MGWFTSRWFGLAGEGGGGSPPSPGNSVTTVDAIRDRIIEVIEDLTPGTLPELAFVPYRDEAGADFRRWARAHPSECTRRFQVRTVSSVQAPGVCNMYVESRIATFDIIVAYAMRWKAGASFVRDDTMELDQTLIERSIGRDGYEHFALSNPNASWMAPSESGSQTDSSLERNVDKVDFLVIRQTMRFFRSTV